MRLPAVPGLLGCVPAPGFVVPAVHIPSARFVGTGTTAGLTRAQQPRSAITAMALLMAAAGDGDKKRPWESFATDVAKKAAVAAAVAASVAFSAPGEALAADSGGRISGGSFSDSSYTSVSSCFQLLSVEMGIVCLHVCGEGRTARLSGPGRALKGEQNWKMDVVCASHPRCDQPLKRTEVRAHLPVYYTTTHPTPLILPLVTAPFLPP